MLAALIKKRVDSFPPAEQLYEALLRRGFYIQKREAAELLWLPQDTPRLDIDFLRQVGLCVRKTREAWLVSLVNDADLEEMVCGILHVEENRGMTSAGWHGQSRMPVCEPGRGGYLDPGVALLVNALLRNGIGMTYSCDGHGKGPARLDFLSDHTEALKEFIDSVEAERQHTDWRIERGCDRESKLWIYSCACHEDSHACDEDQSSMALLDDIQLVARSLLDRSRKDRSRRPSIRMLRDGNSGR